MWLDTFWHHSVHRRLGETLHYYFLHLQPFEPTRISIGLEQLLAERELGNIHCYKLFGRYDLLVRAWLHPNIVHSFPAWLKEYLKHCVNLRPFDVSTIDFAWYDSEVGDQDGSGELLKNLTEDNIRAVQEGGGDNLRDRLLRSRLLLNEDRTRLHAIKFFVAVDLDRSQEGKEEAIAQEVIRYIREDSNLFNEAIYHGHGECDILVKAQATDFFTISRLPNWIGEHFRGAHTETYLSHDPHHMVGSGNIGKSTFDEIRGRDLFVQSILPELYDGSVIVVPRQREDIERFLRHEASCLEIDSKFKEFIHEYALGFLQGRKTEMLRALFEFFVSLEEYLRRCRERFVHIMMGDQAMLAYERSGFSDPKIRKYPPLGNLFRVYAAAIEFNQNFVLSGWEDLVHLRNQMAHGDLDPGDDWAGTVLILLSYYSQLSQLISLIQAVTGEVFDGRYL